jgi:hypothetical protein
MEPQGDSGVASEIDQKALENFGGERKEWKGGSYDHGHGGVGRGQDAKQRTEGSHDVGRTWQRRWFSDDVRDGILAAVQQAVDQRAAALGEKRELAGVMKMLGAEDAGQAEKITIKSKSLEKVSGVVGEAWTFGNGEGNSGRV